MLLLVGWKSCVSVLLQFGTHFVTAWSLSRKACCRTALSPSSVFPCGLWETEAFNNFMILISKTRVVAGLVKPRRLMKEGPNLYLFPYLGKSYTT